MDKLISRDWFEDYTTFASTGIFLFIFCWGIKKRKFWGTLAKKRVWQGPFMVRFGHFFKGLQTMDKPKIRAWFEVNKISNSRGIFLFFCVRL